MVGVAAALLIVGSLFLKIKYGSFLVVFGILFQYFQIIYVFRSLILNWSDTVVQFFDALSIFSFNLDLAKPECVNSSYNYFWKAKVFMAIPPLFLAFLILLTLISPIGYPFALLIRKFRPHFKVLKPSIKTIGTTFYTCINIFHIFLQVIYVSLCSWILGFFSCVESGTVNRVMVKYPGMICGSNEYNKQEGYFALGTIIYVIGIPMYFGILFYLKSQTKHLKISNFASQMLNSEKGDFKGTGQYIIAIHLSLRCLILIVQAFLNDLQILQAIFIMLLTFTYLGFLLHSKPYKKKEHTIIDIFCQICLIVTLSCGILFSVFATTQSKYLSTYSNPLTIIVIFSTIALIVVILVQMQRDIKNEAFRKKQRKSFIATPSTQKTNANHSTTNTLSKNNTIAKSYKTTSEVAPNPIQKSDPVPKKVILENSTDRTKSVISKFEKVDVELSSVVQRDSAENNLTRTSSNAMRVTKLQNESTIAPVLEISSEISKKNSRISVVPEKSQIENTTLNMDNILDGNTSKKLGKPTLEQRSITSSLVVANTLIFDDTFDRRNTIKEQPILTSDGDIENLKIDNTSDVISEQSDSDFSVENIEKLDFEKSNKT
eukprot:NODE_347_length_9026_cov_0.640641.p3 type:complete len:602 gc:universal NODE_347_length_9026_cov_0.640641:6662-4857(-)